jgi:tRNA U54 and U55 pseudouridine synthase Pus10
LTHRRKITREYTYRHNISSPNGKNFWTDGDINFLKNNRFLSTTDIGIAITRSRNSIREKRSRLSLSQLAKCLVCGNTFNRINQHNLCTECVPGQKAYRKNYNNTVHGKWQMYKSNAKKRAMSFELTLEDFAKFWKEPCAYCGGAIGTVGLDRINSTRPYILDNVVACCSRCNEMKMASTTEDWVNQMKTILNHLGESL